MIGFEIEVALPVVDKNGDSFAGDVPLATSSTLDITLVTDHRPDYSNIEFVTAAFSVVGRFAKSGPADLARYVKGVKAIRDALYDAGSKTLQVAGGALLKPTAVGKTAKLDPGNGYTEDADRMDGGNGLFVHYSLGVPLNSLEEFFEFLRDAAPYSSEEDFFLDHARWRTAQAGAVANDAEKLFRKYKPTASAAERSQLRGYIQLVYTQVSAMADYVWRNRNRKVGEDQGQIKNETVALSRSAFSEIFLLLEPSVQAYLKTGFAGAAPLVTLIATYQELGPLEGEKLGFRENDTRSIDGKTWKLIQYAQSALTGAPAIGQQSIFGGMRQIGPHVEEGTTMIPVELRTMGNRFKTWGEVQANLEALTKWVQSAV